MQLAILWTQLGVAAAVILGASLYLAKSSDVIAIKTGLGRSFVGVVLLATATSLPELVTGVSAASLVGTPDLAVGGAFGSNLFNLLIIGLMDLLWWNRHLLTYVGMTSVVIATMGIMVIALGTISLLIHDMTSILNGWPISPLSLVVVAVFGLAMYFIYMFGQKVEQIEETEEKAEQYASARLSRHIAVYAVSASIVVGAAVWLSFVSGWLADAMGWQASFMGTQFLAAATSLPELATSFAALRIAAPELAITNLLGSNLFNMGFVLFLDDVAYGAVHSSGSIWSEVSSVHILTGVIAILMTSVIVLAVVSLPAKERQWAVTIESVVLVGLYAVASVLVFGLG